MSHFDEIMIDLFAGIGMFVSIRFLFGKARKGWQARKKPLTIEQLQAKWQNKALELH